MGGLARIPAPLFFSHPLVGRLASRLICSRSLAHGRKTLFSAALQWSLRETSSPPGAIRHWRTRRSNHALRGCGSGSIPRSTCRGAFPRARARRAAPMATIRPHQGRRGAGPRTCARRSGLGPHVARSRDRCRCCCPCRASALKPAGPIKFPAGIEMHSPLGIQPTRALAGPHHVGEVEQPHRNPPCRACACSCPPRVPCSHSGSIYAIQGRRHQPAMLLNKKSCIVSGYVD
jgi:hypothetical protein